MLYAAQRKDGTWTGALYAEVTERIRAHHQGYEETLHPVLGIREEGGVIIADLPGIDQLRAVMSCTRFQGREALRQAGLFDQARQLIDDSQDATMAGAWDEASVWNRMSPFILKMGGALGLTEDEIDDLFHCAAEITA